jgi:uncharacterized protein (DUF1697 family)
VTTFVALLRGINLGAHNKVPMAELRALVATLGFDNVRTYLQSGNVVCEGRGSPESVSTTLADGIAATFGLDVPVIVRTGAELARVVADNPFVAEGGLPSAEPTLYHVTFLASDPDPDRLSALEEATRQYRPDTFRTVGRDIYLHLPGGYGVTKLNNSLFERRFGVGATTRNWKSVTALDALATP